MDDPNRSYNPGESQTYAADRDRRLRWKRAAGYVISVALWLLSAIPLARLSDDDGGGTGITVAYLAAGLAIAVVIRGIYAWRMKRPFWSPWLFVVAAVLAFGSSVLLSGGDRVPSASSTHVDVRGS